MAVSGGVDSIVLLHALHALGIGQPLVVGHVDHGLRGEGSDEDARSVVAAAEALGCTVAVEKVAPLALQDGHPSRSRPTLQEAARRARADALVRIADAHGADAIVTAHTQDDQAETVLLRLLRGAGPAGLGGIPERSPDGRFVRPLLGISRSAIERFATERGLSWREDPSNQDGRFARARLRHEWLPGLAASFNPRLLNALADLAEAQRRDSEWIEEQVEQEVRRRFRWTEDGSLRLSRDGWATLPEALRRRLARRILRECGAARDVTRRHLERIDRFLAAPRRGRTLELPGGIRIRCEADGFRVTAAPGASPAGC